MSNKITIIILLVVVFYSCNNSKSKDEKIHKITNYENMNFALELSDLIGKMQLKEKVTYVRRNYNDIVNVRQEVNGNNLSVQDHISYIMNLEKSNIDSIYLIEKKMYRKILAENTKIKYNGTLETIFDIEKFRKIVSQNYSLIEVNIFEKEIMELKKYINLYNKRSNNTVQTNTYEYSLDIHNFFDSYKFQKQNEKIPIATIISYIYVVRVDLYSYCLEYLSFGISDF